MTAGRISLLHQELFYSHVGQYIQCSYSDKPNNMLLLSHSMSIAASLLLD